MKAGLAGMTKGVPMHRNGNIFFSIVRILSILLYDILYLLDITERKFNSAHLEDKKLSTLFNSTQNLMRELL